MFPLRSLHERNNFHEDINKFNKVDACRKNRANDRNSQQQKELINLYSNPYCKSLKDPNADALSHMLGTSPVKSNTKP